MVVEPAEAGVPLGTVLDGKYRLDAIVGRGGMGAVYRAHHLQLGEDFAIKLLRRDMIHDSEQVGRFTREAQAVARLRSEHVARVIDIGELDGVPYMVMELLHGADLGALVEQNGGMYPGVAVDLLLQACDAIADAHSRGIVHRDLKPSNLFVSFRPDETAMVKVLDFGISKSAHAVDMALTQTQSVLGTPAYMSPEQMRSAKSVDQRTDIWSLGTVLYELVEGRMPFIAASFSEMCVMVAMDPPAPMVHAPKLAPIVERCLAKDPEQRYANVAELAAALAPYAQNPDAAKFYVTRITRMLSLTRDPSPTAPPKAEPLPVLPHTARMPLSLLTTRGAVSRAAPTLDTIVDGTRLDATPAPRRISPAWFLALALVVVGSIGAVYALTRPPDAQATVPDPTVTPMLDRTPTPAATVTTQAPPSPPDAPKTTAPPAATDAPPKVEAPAADTTPPAPPAITTKPPASKRPPNRPTPPRPAIKKPPTTAKPPAQASQAPPEPPPQPRPPKPKPKCDPFATRTACK